MTALTQSCYWRYPPCCYARYWTLDHYTTSLLHDGKYLGSVFNVGSAFKKCTPVRDHTTLRIGSIWPSMTRGHHSRVNYGRKRRYWDDASNHRSQDGSLGLLVLVSKLLKNGDCIALLRSILSQSLDLVAEIRAMGRHTVMLAYMLAVLVLQNYCIFWK
jgi:hypothetical protein